MIFRRTDKYGYSRYYGDGGPALVIKIVLAVILVIALVVGGIIFAMQKYMVYTENGGHLEFPWDKKPGSSDVVGNPLDSSQEDEETGDGSILDDIVVDDQKDGDSSAPSQEDEPQQTPAAALSNDIRIQHVSIGDATRGYAKGSVDDKNANGIMLYLKESSGKLNYESSLELAETLGVSATSATSSSLSEVITQLNQEGYYTLALVDCFHDESAGEGDQRLYDKGGYPWYDTDDIAWADPANEEMQDYIVGIVQELAAMGYDEVVLKNASYPISGNLDILSEDCYNPDTFEATINSFYAKLAEAMKDSDTILSVVVPADVVTEGADGSGQTLTNLKQLGGRLWVDSDEADASTLQEKLDNAGYPENTLGLLTSSFNSDDDTCQMNLD
jgi:hypothetical protein